MPIDLYHVNGHLEAAMQKVYLVYAFTKFALFIFQKIKVGITKVGTKFYTLKT